MDFDRISAIYDREIVPIWGYPFSRLLFQQIPQTITGTVMEMGCSTGYLAVELAQRVQGKGRILALASSLDMIEIAFQRGEEVVREGKVFFQHHDLKTFRFAEGVFDLIFSNLGLYYLTDLESVLSETLRMLKPQGQAFFTFPMRGSFEDIFKHIVTCAENNNELEVARQIQLHQLEFPSPEEMLFLFHRVGFDDAALRLAPFEMMFRDGAALLESAFFRHHFLLEWQPHFRHLSAEEFVRELQDLFDVYRQGRDLKLLVRAGCISCSKPKSFPDERDL